MTATDPRSQLAAVPAEKLAPAASILPPLPLGGRGGGGPLRVTGLCRAPPPSGGGGQIVDGVMPESITEYASQACRT